MPEYIQIQTYTKCNENNFSTIIRRYRNVLQRLGCTDQRVLEWLSTLRWPISDDDMFGDIYASPFILSPDNIDDIACAGVHISLYSYSAVPSIEEQPSWVSLNLLFDADTLKSRKTGVYLPGVGGTVWHIMRELISSFPEIGVYLTDEWQENRSWRVLTEGEGNPWAFDLAIFPRKLANDFDPTSRQFEGVVLDSAFGFAREERWKILPWVEAEDI